MPTVAPRQCLWRFELLVFAALVGTNVRAEQQDAGAELTDARGTNAANTKNFSWPCSGSCPKVSKETLWQHGPGGSPPPYLAILGHVLNLSGGERFYGQGGSYEFLAGRDATRAFALGTTKPGARTEDVSDLADEKLKAALLWLKDLSAKYGFLGVVVGGHFYDKTGQPTAASQRYVAAMERQAEKDRLQEAWRKQFPRCNTDGRGGFSCGMQGGSPMWVLQPGRPEKERRCACVREPLTMPIAEPIFQQFPECWREGSREKCRLAPRHPQREEISEL